MNSAAEAVEEASLLPSGLYCENSMSNELPWDMITDILSRIPVKSLMRFQCVSTSFHNLISNDPLFQKQHLYHHQSSFKVLVPRPETCLDDIATTCCIVSVSPSGDAREETINLAFPMQIALNRYNARIHNSCDGLFCFSAGGGDVIIWNPSTRQANRLPRGHRDDERNDYIILSLAHDSRSNVYKLLGIFDRNVRLRFYSPETMTWRFVEETPPCGGIIKHNGEPAIVNGAFHWLCPHMETSHVVSLDICDETFGVVAMPRPFRGFAPMLCVVKGKLCVMCDTTDSETRWEMWVMNEYGVADSVTRIFSITFESFEVVMIFGKYCGTLICEDGRLLCQLVGSNKNIHPHAFFESLVSPRTCLGKVSSSVESVANKILSATTSRDDRSKRKRGFFKRLCFCKSF